MFDVMIDILPVFFILMFLLIFGIILVTAVQGVRERRANNAVPVLTVEAQVTAKRTEARRKKARAACYVTFQVRDGEPMELLVPDRTCGRLAEGDKGVLRVQGSRYLQFVPVGTKEN